MKNIIQSYISGYIKCVNDLSTILDKSVTTNNNLKSTEDFVSVFNDIVHFLYDKLGVIVDIEKRENYYPQNKKRVKHKLYVIQGGKKQ